MPLYQSIYAGGYDKEKKAKLEATKLPEKIKCQSCNKLKVPDSFSNNQLLDFKQRLARNPRLALPTSAIITCRQCQPNQVHELECSQCGQMKSLDGFTKAQRRDPDRARCIDCVNDHLKACTAGSTNPQYVYGGEDKDNEGDDDDDGRSNPYADTISNAATASRASASNAETVSLYGLGSTAAQSTIAPRSNFGRPVNLNVNSKKEPAGLIAITPAVDQAVGRQVYRDDSDSDSDDFGYM